MSNIGSVKTLGDYTEQKVRLEGWVYNSRSSGKLGFLMLRDGTGTREVLVSRAPGLWRRGCQVPDPEASADPSG